MRLALFEPLSGGAAQPGLLTAGGVIGVGDLVGPAASPQEAMEALIDSCDRLRLVLEERLESHSPSPLDAVRLLPPLPEPGKIVCGLDDSSPEGGSPNAPRAYLKNPDGVHGDGAVLERPIAGEGLRFDAKLAMVVKGPVKAVARAAWQSAVFGYVCFLDLTRPPRDEWGLSWQTSFDTPCVLGPCIVTADEVSDPGALEGRVGPRGAADGSAAGVGADLPVLVELVASVLTLRTGDVLVGAASARAETGADGGEVEAAIDGVGSVAVSLGAGPTT